MCFWGEEEKKEETGGSGNGGHTNEAEPRMGSRSRAAGPPGREEGVCPLSERGADGGKGGRKAQPPTVPTLPRVTGSEAGTSPRVLERPCSEFWGGRRGSGVASSPGQRVGCGRRVSQCERRPGGVCSSRRLRGLVYEVRTAPPPSRSWREARQGIKAPCLAWGPLPTSRAVPGGRYGRPREAFSHICD